jgi:zinc transporter ZupT
MVWMVLRELIPEALEQAPRPLVFMTAAATFAAMLVFQALLL